MINWMLLAVLAAKLFSFSARPSQNPISTQPWHPIAIQFNFKIKFRNKHNKHSSLHNLNISRIWYTHNIGWLPSAHLYLSIYFLFAFLFLFSFSGFYFSSLPKNSYTFSVVDLALGWNARNKNNGPRQKSHTFDRNKTDLITDISLINTIIKYRTDGVFHMRMTGCGSRYEGYRKLLVSETNECVPV